MATRVATFVAFAGLMFMGCEGSDARFQPRLAVSAAPEFYRAASGSNAQPWELPYGEASSIVEPVPPMDPVLAFPTNRLWQEFWFPIENVARDRMAAPALVRRLVDARPGMQIADVGAGGGYYSFRFARDVGDGGHIWSIDVDGRASSKIAWEAHARGVNNLTAVRVRRGELGLDGLALDAVAMLETGALNTCEPGNKVHYLEQIAMALRPGGHFVFHEVTSDASNPDIAGDARGCRTPTADEVIALARPFFDLERREDVSTGSAWRGYILRLRRR